jgi:translocation and assembly module TamA
MCKNILLSIFLIIFSLKIFSSEIQYKTKFQGIREKEILKKIEGVSQLASLQKKPPKSINALRYRVDGDINEMKKVLNSYGYYDASIKVDIDETKNKILVNVIITPGTRYTLGTYNIYSSPCDEAKETTVCNRITLDNLNANIGQPAISQDIINSRLKLLTELSYCGRPLASISSQKTIVDAAEKQMHVDLCINPGPICNFGPITMLGLTSINPQFIQRKIIWNEGAIYSPEKIEETQKRLLKTDLFSSVLITHDDKLDAEQKLPIKIHLVESKHKNISIGASYATIERFGVTLAWANRNFRKMGEQLSLKADIADRMYSGVITYLKPDFRRLDQNYVLRLQALREKIHVYLSFTYDILSRLDRKFNKNWYGSWGIKMEFVNVNQSINNGEYTLTGLPIFIRYTTANNLLNPTKGHTLTYYVVPYGSIGNNKSFFLKQKLLSEIYIPFSSSDFFVFAMRLQLSSIVGPSISRLPMTKLFFGGSDDDLRGYRYRTVSPRDRKNNPLGGRGTIYCTLEPRFRITKSIGLVPFFDIGAVTLKEYPNVKEKWYKSVGIGLRYFTLFGPFRLDIGFPLNRRKGIDDRYRIYASIGQTF